MAICSISWDKLARSKEKGGLGFRDFQMFNMAMVAKRGWNFISKPDALVTRLFKARYFPNNSFFDSSLGNNPSFAWRSIWKSRQVLMRGCRWMIGDGSNIRVMHDPWLRSEEGGWLSAPQNQGAEAKAILSVPLLEAIQEDKLIWHAEKDGLYTVRSGYQKLMGEKLQRVWPRISKPWWKIWKAQAPPKAKHLMWRICKDCLPTRVRLRNHHVQCQLECPLCLQVPEEDWHLFLECENNKEAWSVMGLSHVITTRMQLFDNIKDMIFYICVKESREVVGKIAVLLWVIWKNRNNYVWNDVKASARQAGIQAENIWNEWATMNGVLAVASQPVTGTATSIPADHAMSKWQPPAQGYLKCNVDASFFDTHNGTGWGWCLRDHYGRFVLPGSNFTQARLNIVEGEAMAMKEAFSELVQRGYSHVIVIEAISSRRHGSSEFCNLISNIKSLLLLVPNFKVKFVRRQANMVVVLVPNFEVKFVRTRRCIFESIPHCITNYLHHDMN